MIRREKILFLKELQKGTASISDIIPKSFRIEIAQGKGKYFIDNNEVDAIAYSKEVKKDSYRESDIKIIFEGEDLDNRIANKRILQNA